MSSKKVELQGKVFNYLRSHPGGASVSQISQDLSEGHANVHQVLGRLKTEGRVESVQVGSAWTWKVVKFQ